jgi:hypothetical protein
VAAAHSASQRITGLEVAASMNVHRCHAETVNVIRARAQQHRRADREDQQRGEQRRHRLDVHMLHALSLLYRAPSEIM